MVREYKFKSDAEREQAAETIKASAVCHMTLTIDLHVQKDMSMEILTKKSVAVDTMEQFNALPPHEKYMHESAARILMAIAQLHGEPTNVYKRDVHH